MKQRVRGIKPASRLLGRDASGTKFNTVVLPYRVGKIQYQLLLELRLPTQALHTNV
jgi:hypothetical protein